MGLVLQANSIKKQYGTRVILDFEAFHVYEGDKIGIVGLNGAGKTTLLRILCGEAIPDGGTVSINRKAAFIKQFDDSENGMSGGESVKKRVQRETGGEDTIIFADEPTANLDSSGVKWVASKLEMAKTVLLISHDRDLLDAICGRIVEIKDGKLHFYTGNYSDYLLQVQKARERREIEYAEYRRKRDQLAGAVQKRKQKVDRMRARKNMDYSKTPSEARLYKDSRASKQKKVEREAKVLKSRLDRLEAVERPKSQLKLRLDFSLTDPPKNKNVITCGDLSFSYGEKIIFSHAEFVIPVNKKTAVTGKNGAGKTTLLNLIYNGYPGIIKAPKLKIGYLRQGFENLDPNLTVLDNVAKNSIQDKSAVFSILAGLLFGGDGFYKKAEILSGGEKIRLSLAMLITSGCNSLILDEPTNYLDVHSIEAVQATIKDYPGTVIIVSHDSRFLSDISDEEIHIEGGSIMHREYSNCAEASPMVQARDKMLLELRRTKLVSAISSAPPEKKDILEREYNNVLKELADLG